MFLYRVNHSEIHGLGVFARKNLPKGTVLGYYRGYRFPSIQAAGKKWNPNGPCYLWHLSNGVVINGYNGLKYLNHSCTPNTEGVEVMVKDVLEIQLQLAQDVVKGEELVLDYNLGVESRTPEDVRRYACLCRARDCRGTMLGKEL